MRNHRQITLFKFKILFVELESVWLLLKVSWPFGEFFPPWISNFPEKFPFDLIVNTRPEVGGRQVTLLKDTVLFDEFFFKSPLLIFSNFSEKFLFFFIWLLPLILTDSCASDKASKRHLHSLLLLLLLLLLQSLPVSQGWMLRSLQTTDAGTDFWQSAQTTSPHPPSPSPYMFVCGVNLRAALGWISDQNRREKPVSYIYIFI